MEYRIIHGYRCAGIFCCCSILCRLTRPRTCWSGWKEAIFLGSMNIQMRSKQLHIRSFELHTTVYRDVGLLREKKTTQYAAVEEDNGSLAVTLRCEQVVHSSAEGLKICRNTVWGRMAHHPPDDICWLFCSVWNPKMSNYPKERLVVSGVVYGRVGKVNRLAGVKLWPVYYNFFSFYRPVSSCMCKTYPLIRKK